MVESKNIVAVFPGQGSQRNGMGKDFYEQIPVCRQTYEEASDALGLDISSICFNDDARLDLTEYTQPCILTTEIAMLRGLSQRFDFSAQWFGGHSLGEFAALVAAGVMTFAETVKIVRARGKLMQEAVPVGIGSMAAVISENIDINMLKKLLENLPVDIANINSANQVVISGEATALPEIEKKMAEVFPTDKRYRFIQLNVSAPFHSRFMKKIEEPFSHTLKEVGGDLNPQNAPKVTSNFTGSFHQNDVASIRGNLVNQLSNTVKWRENMLCLTANSQKVFEIGPGRPLCEFFKTIGVTCQSVTGLTAAKKVFAGAK
jgi:[acyl-carrier-protein] S-malonyltransferase/trans-AT polyketide synthase/acyltransferase/oxidoreductase domain-containing protein